MRTKMMRQDNTWFQFESASAKLVRLDPKVYALSNVYSSVKGQGHAKGLLQEISEYADKHGLTLRLIVQRYDKPQAGGLDNTQLEAFYGKFGFVRDETSYRPHTMTRKPASQEIHVS